MREEMGRACARGAAGSHGTTCIGRARLRTFARMARLGRAAQYLVDRDPVLARIVDRSEPFRRYDRPDLYLDLLESIVSQQLSVKAASTIFGRFLDLFPKRHPDPRRLARMTVTRLRAAGVSRQKAGYLKNVAVFALHGGLDHGRLHAMDDEAVVRHLTAIKGVGRWTVEMLLMFPLDRPDVFPADDLGIQSSMMKLYGLRRGKRLKVRLARIAENWRPHRTLACKFLWRWRSG